MSGLDIDTRSDIYSLGVLLYELLTGTTALEADQLRQAGYAEMQRLIKEQEPPKPSTRLSTSGDKLTIIAQHRSMSPEQLQRVLRGDLDWIVMKALEKERGRRYETPSSFASDVERYLHHQPVEACPPSSSYRLRKFARRNRVPIATSSVIAIALVTATITSSWFAYAAKRSEIEADNERRIAQSRLASFGEASYEQAINAALLGDGPRARMALASADQAGISTSRLKVAEGLIALNDGDYEEAAEVARELLSENHKHIGAQSLLVSALLWGGYTDEWVAECSRLANTIPETDLDRLMMAHAVLVYDSGLAMRLLEDTDRLEHSPIGLLLHSIDHATRGADEQNELIDQAVQDYMYVSFLLPENQGAMAWRAAAIAQAIEFKRNRDEPVDKLMDEGRMVLSQFANTHESPFLNYCRWELCRALGDDQGAWEAAKRAGKHGYFCLFTATECLLRNDPSGDAIAAFDEAMMECGNNDKYVRMARAFLVYDLPGGAGQVRELVDDLAAEEHGLNRFFALNALCLAGDLEYVQKLAAGDRRHVRLERFVTVHGSVQ